MFVYGGSATGKFCHLKEFLKRVYKIIMVGKEKLKNEN